MFGNDFISVRAETKALTKALGAMADKQIPYATVLALNATGKAVKEAEKENIKKVFPTATPFTVNSVRQIRARKSTMTTVVFVMPTAQRYLQPYEDGGVHALNSQALLNPKNVNVNQYGNLPRNKLAALRGRSDVFIGTIKGKSGDVSGVWQRVAAKKARGGKRARVASPKALKLLIRFGDALPVRERLNYRAVGVATVRGVYAAEFGPALAKALATAK